MRRLSLRLPLPWRYHPHSAEPSSPQLPPELILYILLNFVPRQLEESAGVRGKAHRILYNTSLVSRSWHQIAVELLYGTVVLSKSRHLHLFVRTIKTSPCLAALVKSISMVDTQEDVMYSTSMHGSSFVALSAFQNTEEIIPSVVIVLKTCENLKIMSSTFTRSVDFYTRRKDVMRGPTWITSRLRMLSLTGNTLEIMLTHFAFPLLEVLCLRAYSFSRNLRFHQLKRLHTLRLYQPLRGGDSHPFDISSFQEVFPNVRTYELFKEGSSTPMIDVGIFDRVQNLEHASFVECPGVRKFEVVKNCDSLQSLRSFTLGVIDGARGGSMEDSFATWRLPPSLETLTLLIGVPREGSAQVYPLELVVQLLRYNLQPYTPCPLRQLNLRVKTAKRICTPLPNHYLKSLDTIFALCESAGIALEATRERTPFI
ncbi:hypothetical protein NLI96_g641 [Meripilus lineatus]|uniref:F-box domain-containing protein n=1 Tax=Meripilus lineatus TaxID=2056292 RepID=A0AAD5YIA5_9APHY|nr:hypothetical protein NLI96_g641 [Physisporinus lineatus]